MTFLPDRMCNKAVSGFPLLIKGHYFQTWELKCDTQPCAHLESKTPIYHTNLQWVTLTLQSECPQTITCLISFTIHPSSNAAGSVVVASSRKCCECGIKLPALRTATEKLFYSHPQHIIIHKSVLKALLIGMVCSRDQKDCPFQVIIYVLVK
jgi:hypothetical protein